VAPRTLIVDQASTDSRWGKPPQSRSLEELKRSCIVLVDKPAGPTSHQVAAWVRDMFGAKRAGHAGTLDPNATGLLVVAVGDATKALLLVEGADKRYVGHIVFQHDLDPRAMEEVARAFVGPVLQMPPKKSAVRRVRRIRRVFALTLLEASGRDVLVEVACEAGTYIRTLAADLGLVLGVGAHLRDLRRTGVAPFALKEAVSLSALRDALAYASELGREEEIRRILRPVEDLLSGHRRVVVKDSAVDALCHGAPLHPPGAAQIDEGIETGAEVALMTLKGEAIGVGRARLTSEKMATASRGVLVTPTRILMAPSTYPRQWKGSAKGAPRKEA